MSKIRPALSTSTSIAHLRADTPAWASLLDRYPDLDLIPVGTDLESTPLRQVLEQFAGSDADQIVRDLDELLAGL